MRLRCAHTLTHSKSDVDAEDLHNNENRFSNWKTCDLYFDLRVKWANLRVFFIVCYTLLRRLPFPVPLGACASGEINVCGLRWKIHSIFPNAATLRALRCANFTNRRCTFGRVPSFYYLCSLFYIHLRYVVVIHSVGFASARRHDSLVHINVCVLNGFVLCERYTKWQCQSTQTHAFRFRKHNQNLSFRMLRLVSYAWNAINVPVQENTRETFSAPNSRHRQWDLHVASEKREEEERLCVRVTKQKWTDWILPLWTGSGEKSEWMHWKCVLLLPFTMSHHQSQL